MNRGVWLFLVVILFAGMVVANAIGQIPNLWQAKHAQELVDEPQGLSSARFLMEWALLIVPWMLMLAYSIFYIRWHGLHFLSMFQFRIAYGVLFMPASVLISFIFILIYRFGGTELFDGSLWGVQLLSYGASVVVVLAVLQHFYKEQPTARQWFALCLMGAALLFALWPSPQKEQAEILQPVVHLAHVHRD